MKRWLALLLLAVVRTSACTIFVLADDEHALFCNNEDWSSFKTQIWFVPAARDRLGYVCVGFDNQWAQGGMNTAGLAFDWVAGYNEQWGRDPTVRSVSGNPCMVMLGTCTTVAEAVTFFQTHWEPSFSAAKILVADRSGASARIGAHNGQLVVERDTQCRGFGYGQATLDKMLAPSTAPTMENALGILRAARQSGPYATKYSNAFNLRTGDIALLPIPGDETVVTLNLPDELAKGAHYYDMPDIKTQMKRSPRSLPKRAWWRFW